MACFRHDWAMLLIPRPAPLVAELRRVAGSALAEVGALAFPVACAGCGIPPLALCVACLAALRPEPTLRVLESGLRVWSGLQLEGVVARAIGTLKAEHRTPLLTHLAPALAAALDAAWNDACRSGDWPPGHPGSYGVHPAAVRVAPTRLVVVPMPTSAASWRRRGVRLVDALARRAGAEPIRMLGNARRIRDQRGLGRNERGSNLHGSMRCADARGLRVLLVDDVVTTGATLEEASRAVMAAGGAVLGAATAASRPRLFGA